MRGGLRIDTNSVSQVGVNKNKTLLFDQIAGYRTQREYTEIIPKNSHLPKLAIADTLENQKDILQWLSSNYINLDEVEINQSENTLLQDYDLGRTPEERAALLQQSRRVAKVLNIVGGILWLWLSLYPQPYLWAIGVGLAWPVIAAGALWLRPHSLRLTHLRNSGYPAIFIALLGPSAGLAARALLDYQLVSYEPLWPLIGMMAGVAAVVLAIGNRYFLF